MAGGIRVLVAEDNALQREWLTERLRACPDVTVAGVARDGVEALGMMLQLQPQVLVLDMVMPRMDGYALLEKMQQLPERLRPAVIAMTSLGRDDFITRALDMQVHYYLVKPVDADFLIQRIRAAAERKTEMPPRRERPEQAVTTMLMRLGVPAHLTGYKFLRTALMLVLDQPELLIGMTRELYPLIARQYATTAGCVERAIRHASTQAWNRGGGDSYRQLLGRSASLMGDRPSNGEFLAQVSEGLRMLLSGSTGSRPG